MLKKVTVALPTNKKATLKPTVQRLGVDISHDLSITPIISEVIWSKVKVTMD
jgi:hypothetical protein